jgi:hypothetical protein
MTHRANTKGSRSFARVRRSRDEPDEVVDAICPIRHRCHLCFIAAGLFATALSPSRLRVVNRVAFHASFLARALAHANARRIHLRIASVKRA